MPMLSWNRKKERRRICEMNLGNKTKKIIGCAVAVLTMMTLTSCSSTDSAKEFGPDQDIVVVARDTASGTRTAFHELMNVKVKANDTETDNLVVGALEFDSTDKVVPAVEGNMYAIGYISMGSVSDRIKTVEVDGVSPTVENVKNGEYKVARPFILVTNGQESEITRDFLSFVMSAQGQQIVEEKGFIKSAEDALEYTGTGKSGTVKVAGSTSVQPVMEKLQEEYRKLHPDVVFELQAQGSSQGIKAATDGTYDIGMSSRELKDSEAEKLKSYVMALDGIAVIVNSQNPVDDISSDDITRIFTGEVTEWSGIIQP